MRLLISSLAPLLFLFFGVTTFQNSNKTTVKENQDQLELHFTENWSWEYLSEEGNMKIMTVYREPKLNYWLFMPQDSFYGEMCEWIVGTPEGKYFLSYQSPEMKTPNSLEVVTIPFEKAKTFSAPWQATEKQKIYGDPAEGFPLFLGTQYIVHYEKGNQSSEFFGAVSNVDMRPLYYFAELTEKQELTTKLTFPTPTNVPYNFVVLQEVTDFKYYHMRFKNQFYFLGIGPDSRYVTITKMK